MVEWLQRQRDVGHRWGEMAVFYRMNALSRVLEDALLHASIPYQVARGTAFYQRKEIKDALAYLRLLVNPRDQVNLLRVLNTPPRGIGDTTVKTLQAEATAQGENLWETAQRARSLSGVGTRAANAVESFVGLMGRLREKVHGADERAVGFTPSVRDVVEMVIQETGLEAFYKDPKKGDEEKLANLYELVTAAARFDETAEAEESSLPQRLHDYLESVSLVADADTVAEGEGAVTLMTLHAAKGLEFPVVAMVGLEEGILPHHQSIDSPAKLEEERRLCFVGITRSEGALLLTHARYRTFRGLRQRTVQSPFIDEIGKDRLEVEDRSGEAEDTFDTEGAPKRRGKASVGGLTEGTLVRHSQFGLGRVVSVMAGAKPERAKVHFEDAGTRTLVLEYARLEKVG